MGTLEVQPASVTTLHCYANGGAQFQSSTPSLLILMPGIRSVHLVTPGRSRDRWCLVVEPTLRVEEANVDRLVGLVRAVGRQVGCRNIRFIRHIERSDGGPANDPYDWLKR